MLDTTPRHAGSSPGGVDSLGSHACEWLTKHAVTLEHDICTIWVLGAQSDLRLCESCVFAMVAITCQHPKSEDMVDEPNFVPADFLDRWYRRTTILDVLKAVRDKVIWPQQRRWRSKHGDLGLESVLSLWADGTTRKVTGLRVVSSWLGGWCELVSQLFRLKRHTQSSHIDHFVTLAILRSAES